MKTTKEIIGYKPTKELNLLKDVLDIEDPEEQKEKIEDTGFTYWFEPVYKEEP